MKAIAVFPGTPNSAHLAELAKPSVSDVANGRGVLVRVLRVGVDGTDREINAAEYGAAPDGYNFLVVGSPPVVPIVVSIDSENMPVIDVLRNIGLQLGMRGDIKVDGPGRIVELHYPPNMGVGQ